MVLAAPALAQSPPASPLNMHRLYQVVGRLYGIDPDLLAAIARVESNNDPRAVSPKGAEGLMQLMPATAQRFAVNNPFDPVDNLLGAARFLSQLRAGAGLTTPFPAALPDLLAAYNAGPAAVAKYQGVPPFRETREYVRRVLWAYLLDQLPPPAPPDLVAHAPAPTPPRQSKWRQGHARHRSRGGDDQVFAQLAKIQHDRASAARVGQPSEPR